MDLEETIKETLEELLIKLQLEYDKISIVEEENNNFLINIASDNPSILIGYHGENILALQHILKVLLWKKADSQDFNIILDIDSYRTRQEENVLSLAQRKIEMVRKFRKPQKLPPMSPYLRRKIHMMCMESGYEDIETISDGSGDQRYVILKLKA